MRIFADQNRQTPEEHERGLFESAFHIGVYPRASAANLKEEIINRADGESYIRNHQA
jgi:hypothetical protein